MNIVRQVPFPGVRLTELAAAITGNRHALDRGQPLAAQVIRLAPQLDAAQHWRSAAARRDAWETLGVLCDEVSAPVLVLNQYRRLRGHCEQRIFAQRRSLGRGLGCGPRLPDGENWEKCP